MKLKRRAPGVAANLGSTNTGPRVPRLAATAKRLHPRPSVSRSWRARHTQATTFVGGEPRAAMDAAPSEAKSKTRTMYTRAVVAGAAISSYGEAVTSFNAKVDRWNRRIEATKDAEEARELYQDLKPAYHSAEQTLEDAASTSKQHLHRWNDNSTIKELWSGGSLPEAAAAMMPEAGLSLSDRPATETASDVLGQAASTLGDTSALAALRGTSATRFAPRWSNGRFMSHTDYAKGSWKARVSGATQSRNWVPKPGQASTAGRWASVGKWAGRGSGVLTAASGAFDQWTQDANRSDLDTGDRMARSGTRAALDTGGAVVGAKAGAAGGAAAGAAIGSIIPGAGTAAGAAVGGVIGGIVGSGAGAWLADKGADYIMEPMTDALHSTRDWVSDTASRLKFW